MWKLIRGVFVLAIVLFAGEGASFGDELDKLLKRPISPGSVVLLAKYPKDPRVGEQLRFAIRGQDPVTRAVAARVINLAVQQALLPEVAKALAAEADVDAAREQARTLISVGGPSYDDTVLAAARRLAPQLDRQLITMFARVRGSGAIPLYYSALRHLELSPRDREAFFRLATQDSRAQMVVASSQALGRNDSAAWQAILSVAGELGHKLDDPVLVEALRSGDLPIRGEAAWYLAKVHCEAPPADSGKFLTALSESQAAEGADPELRFGAEILRRVLGRPAVEDEAWIACLESSPECHLDSDFQESPLVRFLTPRERKALARRNQAHRPPEIRAAGETKLAKLPAEQQLRLVSGLPRGFVKDLFDVEGCGWGRLARNFGFASLQFRSDGLPRQVSLLLMPFGAACRRAAQSLFLMALAPGGEYIPRDQSIVYAAAMDPEGMSCNEGSELHWVPEHDERPTVMRVRAKVSPPKLKKKVAPTYPGAARQNREQGISIYESIVTATGCIRELRLIKSSNSLLLDIAAMQAVSQWRYEPATLDGRPVNVYLTVTVTFNLN